MFPRLVMTDIDGVWTGGGMYYSESGDEAKRFNTYDSGGVLLLKALDVPVAILTGEQSAIVARRAGKLGIDYVFQGTTDKLSVANELCEKLQISLRETAYIGDDFNDVGLLKCVGVSASPPNAAPYIRRMTDFVTARAGGDGAFRDFVETILARSGHLDGAISAVLENFGQ